MTGLVHLHEPADYLGTESISRANQARLFLESRALRAAAGSLAAAAEFLLLVGGQAVTPPAFIQIALLPPSYEWSGPKAQTYVTTLQAFAPTGLARPYVGETPAGMMDGYSASWTPLPQRINCP